MLVVRGTKKLRDRLKAAPVAGPDDVSTAALGDWFANALSARPQVVLLVNTRTFVPVVVELAPAATLHRRIPAAVAAVLSAHGVPDEVVADELAAMADVRIAPTNDRSVLGVLNELAFFAEHDVRDSDGAPDLVAISLRLAEIPLGPLRKRTGFPSLELAAWAGIEPRDRRASRATPPPAAPGQVLQLKVTLMGTKPPVWRRIVIDGSRTLDHLSNVIQAAFGWHGFHLHELEVGRRRYGVPDAAEDWGDPPLNEAKTRIDAVVKAGAKPRYVYDFGDWWEHEIVLEKVLPAGDAPPPPACIDGRRACPPEDCGGTPGYEELLAILADPAHPEHAERLDWLGGPFDPDEFVASDVADRLAWRVTGAL